MQSFLRIFSAIYVAQVKNKLKIVLTKKVLESFRCLSLSHRASWKCAKSYLLLDKILRRIEIETIRLPRHKKTHTRNRENLFDKLTEKKIFENKNRFQSLLVWVCEEMASVSEILTLENESFRAYLFWTSVLVIKMLAMTLLTTRQRYKNKVKFWIFTKWLRNYFIEITFLFRLWRASRTPQKESWEYQKTLKGSDEHITMTLKPSLNS